MCPIRMRPIYVVIEPVRLSGCAAYVTAKPVILV